MTEFDCIVVGAGVTGASVACALAQAGKSVAVIDRGHFTTTLDKTLDMRVFAITPASESFFEMIGVWQSIRAMRVSPFQAMQVWDAANGETVNFNCRDVAKTHLGHIIENQVLLSALNTRLQQLNVACIGDTTLTEIEENADNIVVKSSAGQSWSTKLLIGADGANSWVRQRVGIELTQRDYQHDAIVATIKTELPHQKTAWQRFLPQGPLAYLPLMDDHLCSIVWSSTREHAASLLALSDEAFNQACAKAFEHRLGEVAVQTQRISFPLYMRHANHYVKPRVALIGDAAHTIHPLAGQGVNLGLADAKALSEVLLVAPHASDIGHYALLRRYERARRGQNTLMISLMDLFKRGFASENKLLTFLRGHGMGFASKFDPLKRFLIKSASGL